MAALLAPALVCLAPAGWLTVLAVLERRSAVLRIDPGGIRVAQPDVLRDPLAVPWSSVRAADVDARGIGCAFACTGAPTRTGSGELDGFLMWKDHSPLAVLSPRSVRPNLALLFDRR